MTHNDVDPVDFVYEVTETVLLDDTDRTMDFFTQLTGLGAN